MGDENTGAASSTVLEVPTDSAAYASWRMTGKMPAAPAAGGGESAPGGGSAPQQHKSDAASAAESGQASEAGTKGKQERPRSNAETRLNEILEDLRHAGLSPSELKTFKRDQARAEGEGGQQQPKGDGKPAPPEKTVQPAKLEPPKKPKMEDFKDWDAYQAALDEYPEKLAEYLRKSAAEEYDVRQRQEATQRELREKIDAAKKRYGDEAEETIRETAKTLFSDKAVPGVVKVMLNESPHLVDLAYVLGSQPDELSAFLTLAAEKPGQALRKIALMEQLIADELVKGSGGGAAPKGDAGAGAGTPGRDASGKFTPAKPVTKAPPPPHEVGGSGNPATDEVTTAAKSGDFRSFRDASNRRDMARMRGQ